MEVRALTVLYTLGGVLGWILSLVTFYLGCGEKMFEMCFCFVLLMFSFLLWLVVGQTCSRLHGA